MKAGAWLCIALALAGCLGAASEDFLFLGTTTSVQDSGLLDALLPAFESETGIAVRPVAYGTGQVIEKAKKGDVDVLLTHSPARELALLEEGFLARRVPVFYNRFALVGPEGDPANVSGAATASEALERIHATRSPFASRADQSGTHDKELALWAGAGLDPATFESAWYKETGTGMGATLVYAAEADAYALTDEATLLKFHSEGKASSLRFLRVDDPPLRNQYSVGLIDPARAPAPIRTEAAQSFAGWLSGPRGQAIAGAYEVAGEPLFRPNAGEAGL